MQSTLPLVIWILITIILVGISYIRYGRVKRAMWRRLRNTKELKPQPVSIIIAARNEAQNLKENLPLILRQAHPKFEVLVVNDGSEDDTRAVLDQLANADEKLRVFHRPAKGKKQAISFGIRQAEHERMLFTDADCKPASENWAAHMTSALQKYEVALGFGGLKGKNNFVGGLSIFETFQTAASYFSSALKGKPYMGVGRNLAYSKSVYQKADGFNRHAHVLSGDDDLFIASLQKVQAQVAFSEESFTFSAAPNSVKDWWKQKRRHYSASFQYPLQRKLQLGLEGLLQVLFYLYLPYVLIHYPEPVLFFFAMRYASVLVWGMPLARHFKAKRELWLFPFWEMCWSVFTSFIHLQNLIFGARKGW